MKNSGKSYMWPLSFIANNQNNICAILELQYVQQIWAKIHSLPEQLVCTSPRWGIHVLLFISMIPCHILWQKKQVVQTFSYRLKKVKSCSHLDSSWLDSFTHIQTWYKKAKDSLLIKEFLKKGLVIRLFWFMRLTGLRGRF